MNIKSLLVMGILLIFVSAVSIVHAQNYGYPPGVKVVHIYATAAPECNGEEAAIKAGAIKRVEAQPCKDVPKTAKKAPAPTYNFQSETTYVVPPPVVIRDEPGRVFYSPPIRRPLINVDMQAGVFFHGSGYYPPYWEVNSSYNEWRNINHTRYLYTGRYEKYPHVTRPAPYRPQRQHYTPSQQQYRSSRQPYRSSRSR